MQRQVAPRFGRCRSHPTQALLRAEQLNFGLFVTRVAAEQAGKELRRAPVFTPITSVNRFLKHATLFGKGAALGLGGRLPRRAAERELATKRRALTGRSRWRCDWHA